MFDSKFHRKSQAHQTLNNFANVAAWLIIRA